jgi:predicted nucleic acid-binding protein
MRRVYADTFYWIALLNPRDQSHQKAITLSRDLQPFEIVTTEDVLAEFLNYCGDRGIHLRQAAVFLVRQMLADPTVQVLFQNHKTFMDGLKLYEDRPDKGYSLTDCISMRVMREESLHDILTNDQHFVQEGFHCLFRMDT